MFEICELNPFDALSKTADQHDGNCNEYSKEFTNNFLYFLVVSLDSDDDFELV